MMKIALIAILLFSAFNVAQVRAEQPNITAIWRTSVGEGKVVVTAFFKNEGDVGVYGTPIATVEAITRTYTNASQRTYFTPHEQIDITITIGGIIPVDYNHLSGLQHVMAKVTVSEVALIDGGGGEEKEDVIIDGGGGEEKEDVIIDGGGGEEKEDVIIDGGGGEEKEDVSISLPVDWTIVGVGVVAAVAIAAVVVVRRKKLTEKDLRKLPSNEFQNWVIQRFLGKASSLRDSRIGIDAYTAEGQPIQIKQSDNIGRNEIDKFASVMGRIKAKNGIVVAFSFSDDVYRGIVRARINYRIEIKKVTVKELIESREIKSL
jgi:hypothetical protein